MLCVLCSRVVSSILFISILVFIFSLSGHIFVLVLLQHLNFPSWINKRLFYLNQPIDHLVNKQWRWRLVWSDMFSSNVTQNDSWIIKMVSDEFTVDQLVCVTDAERLSWKTRSRCMMGKSPPVLHRFGPVLFVLLRGVKVMFKVFKHLFRCGNLKH